ncbi:radical SAM/SPASM domain-containing protein [Desulfovibrio sp. JC010]|uniref:radical SAM/SPASM domain-containing protein n=1 Tax=Desulfovibrio sp. JC010 TaxID=2593641 RepID=UPI0013D71D6C|nr:radical SAM protein [Desulfovibrio sp. JC010]NDV25979.1 radical SAM protein [Desulfovibrio sp. JC010]
MKLDHGLLKKIQRQFNFESKSISEGIKNKTYPSSYNFPIGIQLELTEKCNLYCKHCYNASGGAVKEECLNVDDWKRVTSRIIDAGGVFQCIISGGEPLLLGDDLIDIMSPLHDDGSGFILITNGYLVDSDWINRLKEFRYFWVQVSIDGVCEKVHDDFRGKRGSWEKAKNAALLFSGAGFPLRIAHTVTPYNLKDLTSFIRFAYHLGASSVVCGDVMLSGRANLNQDLLLSRKELSEMYDQIELLQDEYAGRMAILPSSPPSLDLVLKSSKPNGSVIIRPNGDVRLDCTLPFVIGNVLEDDLLTIWNDKGISCWENEDVVKYISDKQNGILTHVNHCDNDFRI